MNDSYIIDNIFIELHFKNLLESNSIDFLHFYELYFRLRVYCFGWQMSTKYIYKYIYVWYASTMRSIKYFYLVYTKNSFNLDLRWPVIATQRKWWSLADKIIWRTKCLFYNISCFNVRLCNLWTEIISWPARVCLKKIFSALT